MFRSIRTFASIALVTLPLVGVASAFSQSPLKEKGTGALTTVAPGFLAFAAQGVGTHFGKYTEVGSANVNEFGHVSNGQFTISAIDGSTLSGTFAGTYQPLETGQIRMDVAVLWQSGTGRFEGVTGAGDVIAFLNGLAPGATFTYTGLGVLEED